MREYLQGGEVMSLRGTSLRKQNLKDDNSSNSSENSTSPKTKRNFLASLFWCWVMSKPKEVKEKVIKPVKVTRKSKTKNENNDDHDSNQELEQTKGKSETPEHSERGIRNLIYVLAHNDAKGSDTESKSAMNSTHPNSQFRSTKPESMASSDYNKSKVKDPYEVPEMKEPSQKFANKDPLAYKFRKISNLKVSRTSDIFYRLWRNTKNLIRVKK